LPVGESDKGFGAEKGQLYYGIQSHYTSIDWWHDPVKGEPFKHSGSLNTFILRPSVVYGISNKYNLTLSSTLGIRSMNWNQSNVSIHHRTESSSSDFHNANGGILGDSKVMIRYLIKNQGMGTGFRIYSGGGITIPSNNQLTSDPYFLNNDEVKEHRHFSLSNGTYNYNIETQIYYKRLSNPTFLGGFIILERPFSESKYGYLPPVNLNIALSMIYKRFDNIDSSMGYGLNILQTGQGYWNGIPAPNTKSTSISPSISFLFGSRFGAIALNLQKPIFIDGAFTSNEGDMDQGSNIWRFSISLRGMPSK
tara:strand:+ start:309 stop:1232 length:924 start_codon:yes stop_codon:yes gene_type:complete